ncbi:MAG: hypothetical protein GY913_05725 [Proteobacteria bacterium]|nr:hypothetical protein [Pseudomonadota bacterium]MCP4916403.1 hypothetical protein [Pseudomonadota bacterium]
MVKRDGHWSSPDAPTDEAFLAISPDECVVEVPRDGVRLLLTGRGTAGCESGDQIARPIGWQPGLPESFHMVWREDRWHVWETGEPLGAPAPQHGQHNVCHGWAEVSNVRLVEEVPPGDIAWESWVSDDPICLEHGDVRGVVLIGQVAEGRRHVSVGEQGFGTMYGLRATYE